MSTPKPGFDALAVKFYRFDLKCSLQKTQPLSKFWSFRSRCCCSRTSRCNQHHTLPSLRRNQKPTVHKRKSRTNVCVGLPVSESEVFLSQFGPLQVHRRVSSNLPTALQHRMICQIMELRHATQTRMYSPAKPQENYCYLGPPGRSLS